MMPPKPTVHPVTPPAKPPTEKSEEVVARAHQKMPPPNPPRRAASLLRQATFRLDPRQRRLVNIVNQHQLNGWAEVFSAYYIGLELAVACTTTQMESSGRMIYGSDPGADWMNHGPYGRMFGEPVTRQNAQWAWGEIQAGKTSNGFGIKQLTSPNLIADANAHGGVWNAQHNCASGDRFFLALIHESGNNLWTAFYHYNGSGPMAERYANDACAIVQTWRARLG
jgi:hypothetical protein